MASCSAGIRPVGSLGAHGPPSRKLDQLALATGPTEGGAAAGVENEDHSPVSCPAWRASWFGATGWACAGMSSDRLAAQATKESRTGPRTAFTSDNIFRFQRWDSR